MTHHTPIPVEQLVERQVRRWELEKQRRPKAPRVEPPPPVITISRAFGAEGAAVARAVAERLGFGAWDHEILHAITERTGMTESLLESLDEHARSLLKDIMASVRGEDDALTYARQLVQVIHTLAHHGGAVIVGRGAQYVVPPARCLRVRIDAPIEHRAASYAARRGIDQAGARAEVERIDRDRRQFCLQHFGQDPEVLAQYDLVINRASFTIDAAARIIDEAFKARFL